jgi:hypothetical protein
MRTRTDCEQAQEAVMKARMVHWGSVALIALVVTLASGCSEDDTVCPQLPSSEPQAPSGGVSVATGGNTLTF